MAAQGASAYAAVPAAPSAPAASSAPVALPADLKTVTAQQAAAAAAVAAHGAAPAPHAGTPAAGHGGVPVPLPHPHAVAQVAQMGAQGFAAYPNMVFAAPDQGLLDDQPTYVNPKQYARILKRRESRKKQTGTDVTSYTPRKRSYMHESRHKHAMQRRRGPGGRFLSKQERAEIGKQAAAERAAAAAPAAGAAPAAAAADDKDEAAADKEA